MEKKKTESKILLSLAKNPKLNSVKISKILGLNISLEEIFSADKKTLMSLKLDDGIKREMMNSIECDDVEQFVTELTEHEISFVSILDDDYPQLLKEIYTPPVILYYKGTIPQSLSVSIVGSRMPTDYGRSITREIAYDLAASGLVITSGLALGIDSIAHEAALSANGITVAVLGCGLDQIYPPRHRHLAERILETGAIISEYPPGVPPYRQNFPARNRIISGLSAGLVVTEAGEGSGSLITARNALEQNREVYAVPGAVYNRNSYGPNSLIKLGAVPITSANDILSELGVSRIEKTELNPRNEEEKLIFEILSAEPKHIDEIIKVSNKTHREISSALTLLEISGKIKHLGGMVYKLNK